MAHLVIVPGGITSKLIIATGLGDRLERCGHRVTVVAPPGDAVERAGIAGPRSTLELPVSAPPAHAPRSPLDRLRAWRGRAERCRAAAAAPDVDGFLALLAGLSPDLVLIDIEAHAHIIAARSAGYRVVLVNIFFNLWRQPLAPPLHVPVTPGVGLRGTRAGIALAWLRYRLWRGRRLLRSRFLDSDQLAVLEAYAQRLGFRLHEEVDFFQGLLPFVYRRLPILNLNLLELDFPHRPHAGSHYVGPMTSGDRGALALARDEGGVAAAIDRLARACRADGGERRLVYCAFGSYYFGDDRDFLRRVIEAFASRPEWTAVLGLGGRLAPEELAPLPPNVHAWRWVPQLHALSRADAAVIHGGMTSVYECLHHGVPIVTYPFAEIFDQYGTAARVRYHRVGVIGDRRRDGPEQIAARIEQVLHDPETRERVAAMRAHMRRYVGEERLGRAVETLLEAGGAGAAAAAPGDAVAGGAR